MMNNDNAPLTQIFVLIGFFLCVRYALMQMFPGVTRMVERMLWKIGLFIFRIVIRQPLKKYGLPKVVWFWCIIFFFLALLQTLAALNRGDGGTAGSMFLSALALGAIVVGGWYLLQYFARRRYTPRTLPVRRRFRR